MEGDVIGGVRPPATWAIAADMAFRGVPGLKKYVDDIAAARKGPEAQLHSLEELFERLAKNNLKIKFPKCKFLVKQTKFAGHLISEHGIRMDQK